MMRLVVNELLTFSSNAVLSMILVVVILRIIKLSADDPSGSHALDAYIHAIREKAFVRRHTIVYLKLTAGLRSGVVHNRNPNPARPQACEVVFSR